MHLHTNKGFSLPELMIVVAIVGILASIAFPAYNKHVREGRRADGTGALLNAAHNLERCASNFGTYNHANCANLLTANNSPEDFYSVSGVATASTYTFTAAVITTSPQENDAVYCNNFTMNNAGARGASGSEDTADCWNE